MYNNLVDSATLTASTENSSFPVNNIKNSFRTKIARITAAAANYGSAIIDDTFEDGDTTGWTVGNNVTIAATNDPGNGQGGSNYYMTMTATGASTKYCYFNATLTSGRLYKFVGYAKNGSQTGQTVRLSAWKASEYLSASIDTNASWIALTVTFIPNESGTWKMCVYWDETTASGTLQFDSFTLYEVTTGSIVFNLGSAQSVTAIAIADYSWASAPQRLQLEFNSSDSWAAPAVTETLTWYANPTANGNRAIIPKTFTSHVYQYVRLVWSYGPAGTLTDTDIGRMHLGTYFEPTQQYLISHKQDMIDPSYISRTIGGQDHVDEISKYREISFAFLVTTQAQWESFQTMINSRGLSRDLFIAFDYDNEPDEMMWYGKFSSLPDLQREKYYSLNFSFRESR